MAEFDSADAADAGDGDGVGRPAVTATVTALKPPLMLSEVLPSGCDDAFEDVGGETSIAFLYDI